jgi:hypothetical protein
LRNISLLSTGTGNAIETTDQLADQGYEHLDGISPLELDRRIAGTDRSTPFGSSVSAVLSDTRHTKVNPSTAAKKLGVSLEMAERTLRVTTQQGIRTAIHPMTKRYRVDRLHLNRKRLPGKWYTDHLFAKVKSLDGNTCAQVITNGCYTRVTPLTTTKDSYLCLEEMERDVGIPEYLRTDLAPELSGKHTQWMKTIRQLGIKLSWSEKGRKNQNHRAEGEIGQLKARWKRRMTEKAVPKRLWDRGLVHEAEIMSLLSRGDGQRSGY